MKEVVDLVEFDLGNIGDTAKGGEYKEAGGGGASVDGTDEGSKEAHRREGCGKIIVGVWGGNEGSLTLQPLQTSTKQATIN